MARKNSRARAKPKPRRMNTRISEAQKSAFERREERRAAQEKKVADQQKLYPQTRGALGPTKLEAKDPGTIQMQRGADQDAIRRRDEQQGPAAVKVPKSTPVTPGSGSITDPIVNPANYGKSAQQDFDAGGPARDVHGKPITLAQIQQQAALWKMTGTAVYMGKSRGTVGGPSDPRDTDFEGGSRPKPAHPIQYDQFVKIEDLASWLSDPRRVAEIKARANKAGLNVESYDDITKLWGSVISMAAKTYQTTGRKVTPWDLIDLRGRYVDPETGKPKKRTGKSITVEEIDEATARLTVEDAVKKMLGRRPTEDEIDTFVAKAQAIARRTPLVETYEQEVGFDDQVVEDSLTVTSRQGGQQVAEDRAQVEMLNQLRNSPDYSNYRAAGVYGPMFFEALGSPID